MKRKRKGAKFLDLSDLFEVLKDRRAYIELGQVFEPSGPNSHWSIHEGRLFVSVETIPDQTDLLCAVGVPGGGLGNGYWDIPRVGAEVLVVLPRGQIDFLPTVIAVTDAGMIPEGLDDEKAILQVDRSYHVRAPEIKLGSSEAFEQVVLGTSYRARENTMLDRLKLSFEAMEAASFGPLASYRPGLRAAIAAITDFLASSARNNDDLSEVVKAI